jgi:hypothetical protein
MALRRSAIKCRASLARPDALCAPSDAREDMALLEEAQKEGRVFLTRDTRIPFQMKAEDRRTLKAGGMTARVRAHLEEILAGRR